MTTYIEQPGARPARPGSRAPQDARILVRLNSADLKRLKDQHAASYHEHRLSFNAWTLRRLLAAAAR